MEEFLAEHRLDVRSIWRKGDDRRSGRKHEDSGFDIGFPDAASWVVGLPVIRTFLDSNAAALEKLRLLGVCVDLDIGVTAGEEQSFAPTLEFPQGFLTLLVTLGVNLNVAAYPTSDEVKDADKSVAGQSPVSRACLGLPGGIGRTRRCRRATIWS